ncbi:MAG: hypothetical protein IPH36_19760 [Saprospiraceae bacterium]|nr:hypothetical protein [Saprospiraceae bacterium]
MVWKKASFPGRNIGDWVRFGKNLVPSYYPSPEILEEKDGPGDGRSSGLNAALFEEKTNKKEHWN